MTIDARTAVLNVARGHTWVREQGANRGQAVEAILKRTGLSGGFAWCAAFVAYIGWSILRASWPLPMVAGCMALFDAATAKGLVRTVPAPGAIFLLWGTAGDGVTRFKHAGFVSDEIRPGVWRTVEGNANAAGSSVEGDGVYVRERTFGPSDRFIWWWAA